MAARRPDCCNGPRRFDARSNAVPRVSTSAILIAFGYYAGANLGLLLRLPPSTPSVLWPPNSILTAALLLTPPRHWWICLLAALPAHLAAEFQVAWPTTLVLALFVTNCSEALIAAAGVRLLSDAPTRFDALRRMACSSAPRASSRRSCRRSSTLPS